MHTQYFSSSNWDETILLNLTISLFETGGLNRGGFRYISTSQKLEANGKSK